jgi:hypothetical protein
MRRSREASPSNRAVRGTLRRRLLVNAVVDPDEAARRLPPGLRPHVTPRGTVVGCCLLEIEDLRPSPLPGLAGISMRAAAHRISAEWCDEARQPVVGVFVPGRRTNSRLAVAAGGRWFPGVHGPARVDVVERSSGFSWRVRSDGELSIDVTVSTPLSDGESARCDPIGGTCLEATVGLSYGLGGDLEAASMAPERRGAREVLIDDLHSRFIDSFDTAQLAPAYLMEHVAVTWTPAATPSMASLATT